MTNYTEGELKVMKVVQLNKIKKSYSGHSAYTKKADIIDFILKNQKPDGCKEGKIRNESTNRCIKTDGRTATEKYEELIKGCKSGQIRNPATGRCVKMDGPTGRKIIKDWEEKQKKKCANDQILNESTNRCVNADGKVAKEILGDLVDDCTPGKIKNPKTGRCVNAGGTIGKNIIKNSKSRSRSRSRSPSRSPSKTCKSPQDFDTSLNRRIFVFDDGIDDTDLFNRIKDNGGEIENIVSFATSYLVVKDGDIDNNSFNVRRAKEYNDKTIITISELKKRLEKDVDSCLVPGMDEKLCAKYKKPDIVDLARRIGIKPEVIRRNTKEELCKLISEAPKREIPVFAPPSETISKDGTCNIFNNHCPPSQVCELTNSLGDGKCITKEEARNKSITSDLVAALLPNGIEIIGDRDNVDQLNRIFDNEVKILNYSDSSSDQMPGLQRISDELTEEAQDAIQQAYDAQDELDIMTKRNISQDELAKMNVKKMISILKNATNVPDNKDIKMPRKKIDIQEYFKGKSCEQGTLACPDNQICDTRFRDVNDPNSTGICVPENILPKTEVFKSSFNNAPIAGYTDKDIEAIKQAILANIANQDPNEEFDLQPAFANIAEDPDIDVSDKYTQDDLQGREILENVGGGVILTVDETIQLIEQIENENENPIETTIDNATTPKNDEEIKKIIEDIGKSNKPSAKVAQQIKQTVSKLLGLNESDVLGI
jgi:hypothetical protein